MPRSIVGLAVVVDVDLLARKGVLARERGLGPSSVPVVAVRDQHRFVQARSLLAARQVAPAHPPARPLSLDAGDLRPERDPVAEAEMVDVVIEVPRDLEMVRVVRIVRRHGVARVAHRVARGVDVQRAVGGRHPVVVFVPPVPTHAGAGLEAVEIDAPRAQHLTRGDSGGAGADHAGLCGQGGLGGRGGLREDGAFHERECNGTAPQVVQAYQGEPHAKNRGCDRPPKSCDCASASRA